MASLLTLVTEATEAVASEFGAVDVLSLTPKQRVVIYLRYVRELSTEETAAELRLSIRAVNRIHSRALDRLCE